MAKAESALLRAWHQGAWWLQFLKPLSWLFAMLSGLRRLAFRTGVLKVSASAVPVIVAGNITVGGSGKSPLVSYLVKAFREQGLNPGIVSRGYGASGAISSPRMVQSESTADEVGDEPLMLFRALGCPVCVCPDRASAVRLLAEQGCDIVIADDGLQHYAMQRDIEICVFDAERLWGNGSLLPAGPLRESLSRLWQVDAVVLNGVEQVGVSAGDYLQQKLSDAGLPTLPESLLVAGMHLQPEHLQGLGDQEHKPLAALQGQKVIAVAGIGHPERFFTALRNLGAQVEPLPFADHHDYTVQDFAGLEQEMIVMTEKDAVKCADLGLHNAWCLPVSAQLSDNLAQNIIARLVAQHLLKQGS